MESCSSLGLQSPVGQSLEPSTLDDSISSWDDPQRTTPTDCIDPISHIRVLARIRPMNQDEAKRGSKRGLRILQDETNEAPVSQAPPDGLLARLRSSFSMAKPTTTTHDDSMSSLEEFDQGIVLGHEPAADVNSTNDVGNDPLPTTIVAESSSGRREFELDGVFGPLATQQYVYENSLVDMAKHLFTGYNTTILAYGQTGSGKVCQ